MKLSLTLLLTLMACGEKSGEVDPLTVDDDGDGFSENDGDCDDTNAELSPIASEICDSLDNDCDGNIDDGDDDTQFPEDSTYYSDLDGDGFGALETAMQACSQPSNSVTDFRDCDDDNAAVHPDAIEVCDELDNDCDTLIDDGDDSLDASTGTEFFADTDDDGEGDPIFNSWTCIQPEGFVTNNTDCDDFDAAVNTADADGDGITTCGDPENNIRDCDDSQSGIGSVDNDGDGYIACINDCNDLDAKTSPAMGIAEADLNLCVQDADGDGYGDMYPEVEGVEAGSDCNDSDDAMNQDDLDGDGITSCAGDCDDDDVNTGIIDLDGDGYSGCTTDCDDSPEDLDGDGVADGFYTYPGAAYNELDPSQCLTDADGDGYGGSGTFGCWEFVTFDSYGDGWNGNQLEIYEDGVMTGSVANQNLDGVSFNSGGELNYETYCFDGSTETVDIYFNDGSFNSEISFEMYNSEGNLVGTGQGAGSYDLIFEGITYTDGDMIFSQQVLSGIDCDDNDAAIVGDDDGDGFSYCSGDCDDDDANINPSATEVWYDGIDQNCDSLSDFDQDGDGIDTSEADCNNDGTTETECDLDGDGAADWLGGSDCDDTDATITGDDDGDGFSYCSGDCDDTDPNINPDSPETYYDGIDTNCNTADEFDADLDGDMFAELDCDNDGVIDASCDFDGDGVDDYIAGTDCDDSDASINGLDTDLDGFASCEDSSGLSDCDDNDAYTFPGAAFNDSVLECLTDGDGDGYGFSATFSCYLFELSDTWGDGWNGNAIEVYEDDVLTGTYENQDLDGIDNDQAGGETQWEQHCLDSGTSTVDFVFIDGYYNSDVIFNIYFDDGADGILDKGGYGQDPYDFYFENIAFTDEDIFYSVNTPIGYGGSDSDDSNASIH